MEHTTLRINESWDAYSLAYLREKGLPFSGLNLEKEAHVIGLHPFVGSLREVWDHGNSQYIQDQLSDAPLASLTANDVLQHLANDHSTPTGALIMPISPHSTAGAVHPAPQHIARPLKTSRTEAGSSRRRAIQGPSSHKSQCVLRFKMEHIVSVLCCAFSGDGNLLATGGRDKKVSVWDLGRGVLLGRTAEHLDIVDDVGFCGGRGWSVFATACRSPTILLWNALNMSEPLLVVEGHKAPVVSVDFNPSDPQMMCSLDRAGVVGLWKIDLSTATPIATWSTVNLIKKGPRRQIRLQHNNVFAAAIGKTVGMREDESRSHILRYTKAQGSDVQWICWDWTGDHLATITEDVARIWSRESNLMFCTYEIISKDNIYPFRCCTFHPTRSLILLIAGGGDKTVQIWDCARDVLTTSITLPIGDISAMVSYLGTGLIASTSDSGDVLVWKLEEGN